MHNKLFLMASLLLLLGACDRKEVGDISLGILTTKDIKIDILHDPAIPGVVCHISRIEVNLSFSDPSDSSISCRQTGQITSAMLAHIDKSSSGDVIFNESKSVLFKTLKVRRVLDAENQTLLYISYSTKAINGSYKHSLSSVPLWSTEAYQKPAFNS